ncbi:aminotransferase DegT [Desulfonema ishimotonii]|uniref:Aminotransferase DegT n=1 Tax=Desulfonema ishimotonii TaxID=45657 RepID=A0A401FSI0_9BACT|nr:DegT/DnrJ/EryC1/StrS family aminotransferase [Desulfonema ishimotonii]GBC59916.1 aminotransferase DegT [Desulfonema ishimotonii]
MQFIDLGAQQRRIRQKIEKNILAVLDHGRYIMGPEIGELEQRLADYAGVRHVLGCSSGTDALLMALMAHDVGPGDAVFTTPFTFIATAEVIRLLGATPVFAEIDPATFNLDPASLEKTIVALKTNAPETSPLPGGVRVSDLTPRGIIAVDLFGLPADYSAIGEIARKHGLFVIEDAAQSFGAESGGRRAGAMADIACTSFFPAKPLGCYGDGGALFTDNDALVEKMASIRVHGKGIHKYDNARIGINGRLDAIQAAILLAKLDIFPDEIERRQGIARRYSERLSAIAGLTPPSVPDGYTSAWAQYSVLAADEEHRAALQARLKSADVPTAIYYPKPLHMQTAFADLGYRAGDFPVSEDFARRIFSLPMHPYLEEADQIRITDILAGA